jgi:hypothetical protein
VNFVDAQGSYLKLQQRLAIAMGEPVLLEVKVDPPRGDADELSFQKVVAWAYIVLHETGRIPLNFLKELPPFSQFGALLPHVRDLRTWISHNLALDKAGDRSTLGNAFLWLRTVCGTTNPKSQEDWRKCISALCRDLSNTLDLSIASSENLLSKEDGPRLVEEFRKRLSANWDAYKFDPYVDKSRKLFGYMGLDVVEFRKRHLTAWRSVVEAAEPSKRDELLTLRIEADLLSQMANALPWPAAKALARVKLNSGAELAGAMLLIRRAAEENRADIARVLEEAFPEAPTARPNDQSGDV